MSFEIKKRRALIVYMKNMRQARQLRRFGIVNYISNKLKYASVYVDEADVDEKKRLIERLGFVDHVEESHWPEVDTTVGGQQNEEIDFTLDNDDVFDDEAQEKEL
ncbi:uncharacterized protein YlbG (UPF0298 family) [Weissella uvarum]|uniref:YlbG family protein n=1 Tax=Weissella uvarum TaxID=1479233 RepID=UPI001961D5B5|nr:YlbG family protein [Weissella uvarum]MBM7617522.1 uncharacterized protein YlbG (UPF0298 family) [Weissella uvarum]MCM0595594.1 YlbG family protein [Weissella uvarum]